MLCARRLCEFAGGGCGACLELPHPLFDAVELLMAPREISDPVFKLAHDAGALLRFVEGLVQQLLVDTQLPGLLCNAFIEIL